MAWMYLLVAGVLEIGWAVGLKYTDGLRRPWPTALTVAAMLASFYFLSLAVRNLPLGTAYAAWTGMGVLGTAVLGVVLFQETTNAWRLACIGLILVGIVGLELSSKAG